MFTGSITVLVGVAGPMILRGLHPVKDHWGLPWWVLAAGFAAGGIAVIRLEFFGELQEVTLSEIPLLVGLVFTSPDRLLLATLVGATTASVLRRGPPIKTVFNIAVRSLETIVAAVCFHAVLGSGGAFVSVRGALAALAAIATANLVSAVCVQCVISLSLGRLDRSGLKTLAIVLSGVALLNVSMGILAADLLWWGHYRTLPFLAVSAAALGFAYRLHSRLRQRHHNLEAMYRFSRKLAGLSDTEAVTVAVLTEARSRLRGAMAELVIDEAHGTVRYALVGRGPVVRSIEQGPHPLRNSAVADGGIVVSSHTDDVRVSRALSSCGYQDAVVATLPSIHGSTGILVVADRLSDQLDFERADLDLLQVLAVQTGTALQSAQLLHWLREEVAVKDHQASHDSLTDLANRALFDQQLEAAIAQRDDRSILAVMLIDLDRFKEINDTLGHQSGDFVLQQIAGQLTRAVAGRGCVGRLGGDEFGVVALTRDGAELAAVTRDVLAAGSTTISVGEIHLGVRASVGVALAPDHGLDRSTLMRAADIAMYHAKTNAAGAMIYRHEWDNRRAPSRGRPPPPGSRSR